MKFSRAPRISGVHRISEPETESIGQEIAAFSTSTISTSLPYPGFERGNQWLVEEPVAVFFEMSQLFLHRTYSTLGLRRKMLRSHCISTDSDAMELFSRKKVGGRPVWRTWIEAILLVVTAIIVFVSPAFAADLSEKDVKAAIDRGRKFLEKNQKANGSWTIGDGGETTIGVTSLCVLSLLNSGSTPQEEHVRGGLKYLRSRSIDDLAGSKETYQTSLMIMALAATKENSDLAKILTLAQRLEGGQITKEGVGTVGAWSYALKPGVGFGSGGDQSNTQFAILGLREAVETGYVVDRQTWERARDYWEGTQKHDGGWGYGSREGMGGSRGSMTVAGVASIAIIRQMLKSDEDVAEDGTPPCCQEPPPDKVMQIALSWLGKHFAAHQNPGTLDAWLLYYVYGIERAGRLSGQRFFGDHDWYREGTEMLLSVQTADGYWIGTGTLETQPVIGTSFALLFLSKGLAPVLVNKLKYGPINPNNQQVIGDQWNRHPRDVRNLTDLVSGLPKWPKLLTSQEVDIHKAVKTDGVKSLLQSRILFITGPGRLDFKDEEVQLLKDYLEQGHYIFACPTCENTEFEPSFRELVKKLVPPGEGELTLLPPEHPVYRSENPLPAGVKLFGVDFGCMTAIIYSPEDLGCLWEYWSKVAPPKRNVQLKAKVHRATQIGVNLMAYFTGREPPDKTQVRDVIVNNKELDNVERGLLQIAQIKHEGAWNAAPHALRNLLVALNQGVGLSASTKIKDLTLGDKNIFRYPVLYMHGRNQFSIPAEDGQQLIQFLNRGGVLVADSCCGARRFDKSFREFIGQLYPDKKLQQIPITHEIFSEKIGQEIKMLKRRTSEGGENAVGGTLSVRSAEPILEGIEIDGRYAVIYSKFDISCALERQNSGNCEGYVAEDAVKLGTNIILYSMLQNMRLDSAATGLGK